MLQLNKTALKCRISTETLWNKKKTPSPVIAWHWYLPSQIGKELAKWCVIYSSYYYSLFI